MSAVVLYSRVGCHLCDEARAVINRVVGSEDTVEVIDIDVRADLTDAYTVRVPVVEVDGVEVAQYQVSDVALAAALQRLRPSR